jgi:hypothetical protein|tara:strand:+ start:172 stop:483 length:312 start_codon:yes stop_codon:yes gene_type:complete
MQDNPKYLRSLKVAVITMGILIILGIIVIVSTIIYRISSPDYNLSSENRELNIQLNIPNTAEIISVNSNRKAVTIFYKLDDEKFIKILDLENGKLIKKIKLEF